MPALLPSACCSRAGSAAPAGRGLPAPPSRRCTAATVGRQRKGGIWVERGCHRKVLQGGRGVKHRSSGRRGSAITAESKRKLAPSGCCPRQHPAAAAASHPHVCRPHCAGHVCRPSPKPTCRRSMRGVVKSTPMQQFDRSRLCRLGKRCASCLPAMHSGRRCTSRREAAASQPRHTRRSTRSVDGCSWSSICTAATGDYGGVSGGDACRAGTSLRLDSRGVPTASGRRPSTANIASVGACTVFAPLKRTRLRMSSGTSAHGDAAAAARGTAAAAAEGGGMSGTASSPPAAAV